MKKRELVNFGIPAGEALRAAQVAVDEATNRGWDKQKLRAALKGVVSAPAEWERHEIFGRLALRLVPRKRIADAYQFRSDVTYPHWGRDIDDKAHQQMRNACQLPVTVAAALMPDAHVGYGLPIGGVLATKDAVIPYAVGVDIACRVRMTVFDLPAKRLEGEADRLAKILERETMFGIGSKWRQRKQHEVLDRDWSVTPLTQQLKDLAWKQLGTSGSGNHFVEFGEVEFGENGLGVAPGRYIAVVSHSGSRGPGAKTCAHYSKVAEELHPNLPKHFRHLAWLPMDGVGAEYWAAMELMGAFASANHAVIHDQIRRAVGAGVVYNVENHHNYAWKETHGGEELIVHRKGATPAGVGAAGYIPGSMTQPGYVVVGKGDAASLDSASHGAGRQKSRKATRATNRWSHVKQELREANVRLLSAGLDEAPNAYKDMESVMAAQDALVERVARFEPRIVKMAPDGERPED